MFFRFSSSQIKKVVKNAVFFPFFLIFLLFLPENQKNQKKFKKNSKNHLHFKKSVAYYVISKLISGRSSVVEHHVANVIVEGSTPFTRSIFLSHRRFIP